MIVTGTRRACQSRAQAGPYATRWLHMIRRMNYARLITRLYSAFNDRDIDALLAQMTEDVDWPNAWEGGRVRGHDGVRDYWTRQWAAMDPTVEPGAVTTRLDGNLAVDVHQLVRSLDGALLGAADVVHVYSFRGGLIARMDVEEPSRPSASATFRPSSDHQPLETRSQRPERTDA
jgi:hypothetical protein